MSASSVESSSSAATVAVVSAAAAATLAKSGHSALWRELAFLIVGAVFAVGAEEVRDIRHRTMRTTTALTAVRVEIQGNIEALRKARAHHLEMAERLSAYAARGELPPDSVYGRGIFRPAILQSSAWQMAVSNGAVSSLSFPTALAVATVAERATRYRGVADAIGESTMSDIARYGTTVVFRDRYRNFISIERDFAGRENSLAEAYARILDSLPAGR